MPKKSKLPWWLPFGKDDYDPDDPDNFIRGLANAIILVAFIVGIIVGIIAGMTWIANRL